MKFKNLILAIFFLAILLSVAIAQEPQGHEETKEQQESKETQKQQQTDLEEWINSTKDIFSKWQPEAAKLAEKKAAASTAYLEPFITLSMPESPRKNLRLANTFLAGQEPVQMTISLNNPVSRENIPLVHPGRIHENISDEIETTNVAPPKIELRGISPNYFAEKLPLFMSYSLQGEKEPYSLQLQFGGIKHVKLAEPAPIIQKEETTQSGKASFIKPLTIKPLAIDSVEIVNGEVIVEASFKTEFLGKDEKDLELIANDPSILKVFLAEQKKGTELYDKGEFSQPYKISTPMPVEILESLITIKIDETELKLESLKFDDEKGISFKANLGDKPFSSRNDKEISHYEYRLNVSLGIPQQNKGVFPVRIGPQRKEAPKQSYSAISYNSILANYLTIYELQELLKNEYPEIEKITEKMPEMNAELVVDYSQSLKNLAVRGNKKTVFTIPLAISFEACKTADATDNEVKAGPEIEDISQCETKIKAPQPSPEREAQTIYLAQGDSLSGDDIIERIGELENFAIYSKLDVRAARKIIIEQIPDPNNAILMPSPESEPSILKGEAKIFLDLPKINSVGTANVQVSNHRNFSLLKRIIIERVVEPKVTEIKQTPEGQVLYIYDNNQKFSRIYMVVENGKPAIPKEGQIQAILQDKGAATAFFSNLENIEQYPKDAAKFFESQPLSGKSAENYLNFLSGGKSEFNLNYESNITISGTALSYSDLSPIEDVSAFPKGSRINILGRKLGYEIEIPGHKFTILGGQRDLPIKYLGNGKFSIDNVTYENFSQLEIGNGKIIFNSNKIATKIKSAKVTQLSNEKIKRNKKTIIVKEEIEIVLEEPFVSSEASTSKLAFTTISGSQSSGKTTKGKPARATGSFEINSESILLDGEVLLSVGGNFSIRAFTKTKVEPFQDGIKISGARGAFYTSYFEYADGAKKIINLPSRLQAFVERKLNTAERNSQTNKLSPEYEYISVYLNASPNDVANERIATYSNGQITVYGTLSGSLSIEAREEEPERNLLRGIAGLKEGAAISMSDDYGSDVKLLKNPIKSWDNSTAIEYFQKSYKQKAAEIESIIEYLETLKQSASEKEAEKKLKKIELLIESWKSDLKEVKENIDKVPSMINSNKYIDEIALASFADTHANASNIITFVQTSKLKDNASLTGTTIVLKTPANATEPISNIYDARFFDATGNEEIEIGSVDTELKFMRRGIEKITGGEKDPKTEDVHWYLAATVDLQPDGVKLEFPDYTDLIRKNALEISSFANYNIDLLEEYQKQLAKNPDKVKITAATMVLKGRAAIFSSNIEGQAGWGWTGATLLGLYSFNRFGNDSLSREAAKGMQRVCITTGKCVLSDEYLDYIEQFSPGIVSTIKEGISQCQKQIDFAKIKDKIAFLSRLYGISTSMRESERNKYIFNLNMLGRDWALAGSSIKPADNYLDYLSCNNLEISLAMLPELNGMTAYEFLTDFLSEMSTKKSPLEIVKAIEESIEMQPYEVVATSK